MVLISITMCKHDSQLALTRINRAAITSRKFVVDGLFVYFKIRKYDQMWSAKLRSLYLRPKSSLWFWEGFRLWLQGITNSLSTKFSLRPLLHCNDTTLYRKCDGSASRYTVSNNPLNFFRLSTEKTCSAAV